MPLWEPFLHQVDTKVRISCETSEILPVVFAQVLACMDTNLTAFAVSFSFALASGFLYFPMFHLVTDTNLSLHLILVGMPRYCRFTLRTISSLTARHES
jgi:hypothetical protein